MYAVAYRRHKMVVVAVVLCHVATCRQKTHLPTACLQPTALFFCLSVINSISKSQFMTLYIIMEKSAVFLLFAPTPRVFEKKAVVVIVVFHTE